VAVINAKEEVSDRRWQWTLFANPARRAYAWDVAEPAHHGFLARRGIPTIALLDVFRSHFRATGTSGFYEWDDHWTPAGHELAADGIARAPGALELVPTPSGGESRRRKPSSSRATSRWPSGFQWASLRR